MEEAIFTHYFQDSLLKALALLSLLYLAIEKSSRLLWVLHQGKEKCSGRCKHWFAQKVGTSHSTLRATNIAIFWLTVTTQDWVT